MSKYKPFSQKQLKVLTWWMHPEISNKYSAVIADGSIRSGKTMSMSHGFVFWAMTTFENQNFAICGKTVGSCYRNVIKPLTQIISGRYQIKYLRSENLMIVKQGAKTNYFYIFGGRDESSQDLIQGITLAGVLLDEVALMPRSFVEQALARCSVEGSRFWFNCNPDSQYHWFYAEWIQKSEQKEALYLHFDMDDNLTLSPKIKERYKAQYSGVFYERYILGRWVAADGIIYPMFSKEKCVVPTKDRPYTMYYVSIDYGTLNPFSAGLWGLSGGVWYRIKEYYYDGRKEGRQKTDEEYYRDIDKLIGKRNIRSIIIDPSAASFITLIRRKGKYSVMRANNAVLDGIRETATCLQNGKIKFNDCCENTFKEFSSYVWDTKHAEATGEDKPMKVHDHAMDDIRYFVNTIIARRSGAVDLRR